MNCWSCNHELIWGGDHDGEDYCNEEYNIVTNLSCPRCGATVETYRRPIHVISKLHTVREKDAS